MGWNSRRCTLPTEFPVLRSANPNCNDKSEKRNPIEQLFGKPALPAAEDENRYDTASKPSPCGSAELRFR
jgi:hypothetical protein